jgi:hypothetical protein
MQWQSRMRRVIAVVSQLRRFRSKCSLPPEPQETIERRGSRIEYLRITYLLQSVNERSQTRNGPSNIAKSRIGRHGGVRKEPKFFPVNYLSAKKITLLLRHFTRLHRNQYGVSALSVSVARGSKEACFFTFPRHLFFSSSSSPVRQRVFSF